MANFLNDTTFKQTLQNYTVGQYNNADNLTALFASPFVQVPTVAGNYQVYDSLDAFQLVDTERQPGQAASVVTFKGTPTAYSLTPNALDTPIDQGLLDMADPATAMIHYESVAKYLVSVAHTNLEYQIWNTISASVTTTVAGTGWSTASGSAATVNPISVIEEQYYTIASNCGIAPNRMICGYDAWRYLKHSYYAKGLMSANYWNDAPVKEYFSQIGSGLDIKIAFAGYGSNKGQSTRTITPIVNSKEIWLFYASDSPDRLDRSAFKTLTWGTGVQNLRSYVSPDQRVTFLAVDWYVKPVVANSFAVKRIVCT